MEISNNHRSVSWEKVAKEMQAERDRLQSENYSLRERIFHLEKRIEVFEMKTDQYFGR